MDSGPECESLTEEGVESTSSGWIGLHIEVTSESFTTSKTHLYLRYLKFVVLNIQISI